MYHKSYRALATAAALLLSCGVSLAQSPPPQSPPAPQPGIDGAVAPGVTPELVQDGFSRLEGAIGAPDGTVYFSDRSPDRTYHVGKDGKITVFRENTHAANGIEFLRDGTMIVVEALGGLRVSKVAADGTATPLTESYEGGKPFKGPNDLIADAKGGIYFTDLYPIRVGPGPAFDTSGPHYVFYLPPGAKEAIPVERALDHPNGLTITLDGKTLVVDNSGGPDVFAYDIQPDGTLTNKHALLHLQDIAEGKSSGADGMAIDSDGRFYICTAVGIQVFDAKGVYLGRIQPSRTASNLAFSGPGKGTLYITGRDSFYRMPMLSHGPDRLGK